MRAAIWKGRALKHFSVLCCVPVAALTFCARACKGPDGGHLPRIQTVMAFKGERLLFDDTIFCGAGQRGALSSRLIMQAETVRRILLRPTGFLSMQISRCLCSLRAGGDEIMRRAPDRVRPRAT